MLAADDRVEGGDLATRWRTLRHGDAPGVKSWQLETQRLERIVGAVESSQEGLSDDEAIGWVLALAHPGRLARARGNGTDLLLA